MSSQMKSPLAAAILLVFFLQGVSNWNTGYADEPTGAAAPTEADAGGGADIESLQRERAAILREYLSAVQQQYKAGAATLHDVSAAMSELLEAELALANTSQERIAIRKDLLKVAQDLEKTVAALYQAGEAGHQDVLRAKAERLKAHIALLREQQASKSE